MRRTHAEFLNDRASQRMRDICSLIPRGRPLYDIGCDHGLVGMLARETLGLKQVYLVDESAPIIERLNESIDRHGVSRDGLVVMRSRGEDLQDIELNATIVLAGMGFHTIKRMVETWIDRGTFHDNLVICCANVGASELQSFFSGRSFLSEGRVEGVERGIDYSVEAYRVGRSLRLLMAI